MMPPSTTTAIVRSVNPVFLDTSYLLALEFAKDQNHQASVRHWQRIVANVPPLVTTSYVLDEAVTFFNNRGHHGKAIRVGNTLLYSPSVSLIQVDETLFYEGWQYFQQHQGKRYSLTDCISFMVMRKLGAGVAFIFDRHFAQAGFTIAPEAPSPG